jgi:acylglycerol lipase
MRAARRRSFFQHLQYLVRLAAVMVLVGVAAACSPREQGLGPATGEDPHIDGGVFVARDGARLPVRRWPTAGAPADGANAVILALHGFNMYGGYFAEAAAWWAGHGIVTYAYDQRGFGGTPERGIWGGEAAFVADATDMLALVRQRHPGVPVFLLGDSMGGGIVILTLKQLDPPARPDGVVLVAPAVWGGDAMNAFYRYSLWLAAHTMPWNLASATDLRVRASDNIDMLRQMGRDPLVVHDTRIDAVYGVANLMGQASIGAPSLGRPPVLMLYGANDEIIPLAPTQRFVARLPGEVRLALYEDGYHMLLRDLQAETVWRDIAAWIGDRSASLPSGADKDARSRLRQLQD